MQALIKTGGLNNLNSILTLKLIQSVRTVSKEMSLLSLTFPIFILVSTEKYTSTQAKNVPLPTPSLAQRACNVLEEPPSYRLRELLASHCRLVCRQTNEKPTL